MHQTKYISKLIEVTYCEKRKELYLVAHFSINKISGHEGYLLYLTNNSEKWDPRDHLPLINALFFETPEDAFRAGEEILKIESKILDNILRI